MAMRGRNLMGGRNPGRAKAIQQALREALSGGATGGMAGGMRPRKRPNMMGEAGKTMSDADRQRAMDRAGMLQALEAGEMGQMSDADLAMLRKKLGMMGGGAVMRYKKGGAVKKTRTKKPKNGCVMKGRGGKYKGQK